MKKDKKVQVISMLLGDKEVARVIDGAFQQLAELHKDINPDLFQQYYNDCFYKTGAKDFETRFKLVEDNNYFCYSKLGVRLIAREFDSGEEIPLLTRDEVVSVTSLSLR